MQKAKQIINAENCFDAEKLLSSRRKEGTVQFSKTSFKTNRRTNIGSPILI